MNQCQYQYKQANAIQSYANYRYNQPLDCGLVEVVSKDLRDGKECVGNDLDSYLLSRNVEFSVLVPHSPECIDQNEKHDERGTADINPKYVLQCLMLHIGIRLPFEEKEKR